MERAFAVYVEQGNRCRAAVVALFLAETSYIRLAASVASGWVSRAERLLKDEPEAVEHGYLARLHARIAFEGQGDLDRALEHAERASELGTRFGDRDLEMLALHDRGCILLARGRVEDGMSLMDEAMVAAVAGGSMPKPYWPLAGRLSKWMCPHENAKSQESPAGPKMSS